MSNQKQSNNKDSNKPKNLTKPKAPKSRFISRTSPVAFSKEERVKRNN